MGTLLDIAISSIIALAVLLILVGVNLYISSNSVENVTTKIVQANLDQISSVTDYDFYKIGYRVTDSIIVVADSQRIKYYVDLNDDGLKDSITYYLGSTSELATTPNPRDRYLYRVENNQTAKSANLGVTDFKLYYYDSTGAQISYSSLSSQNSRDRIRSIGVYIKVESAYPIEGIYQAAEWKKIIRPKNIF